MALQTKKDNIEFILKNLLAGGEYCILFIFQSRENKFLDFF